MELFLLCKKGDKGQASPVYLLSLSYVTKYHNFQGVNNINLFCTTQKAGKSNFMTSVDVVLSLVRTDFLVCREQLLMCPIWWKGVGSSVGPLLQEH